MNFESFRTELNWTRNDTVYNGKQRVRYYHKNVISSQIWTMLVWYFGHRADKVKQCCYKNAAELGHGGISNWFLHNDNASAQYVLFRSSFLDKKYIALLDYPHYSPDLAPCDFCLLLKLRSAIKRRRLSDVSNTQRLVVRILKSIPEYRFPKQNSGSIVIVMCL